MNLLGIVKMDLFTLTALLLLLLDMFPWRTKESFDLFPLVVRSLILDLHPENGTKEGLLQLYQFQGVVWNDDILRIDRERFRILILIIKGFSRGCRVCDCSTNSPSQCACDA